MVYVALGTVLSFMLFCAVRDSDDRISDSIVGSVLRLAFDLLKFCWLAGVFYLIYCALFK